MNFEKDINFKPQNADIIIAKKKIKVYISYIVLISKVVSIMGIGRIGGFYQNYQVEPIKRVELDTVREQDAIKKQQENEIPVQKSQDTLTAPDNRSRMADLENISLTFNTGDTYDYIGKDSDLTLLDMDKVLSDMKKDSVLDQYRYFVGAEEANSALGKGLDGDGIVVLK